jgi:hypothetical protein
LPLATSFSDQTLVWRNRNKGRTARFQTITDDGTNKFIIVNPPTGNRFYRLFKP